MNIPMVKQITGIVAGVGVGTVVSNVVRATTPPNAGMFTKVSAMIGSFTISGILSVPITKYTDLQVDKTIAFIAKLKS
jgi:hypothetical protein